MPSLARAAGVLICSALLSAHAFAEMAYEDRAQRLVRTFKGHGDAVGAVVFSPDSRSVISGGDDGNIRIWSVETGAVVRTIETPKVPLGDFGVLMPSRISSLDIAGDGVRLLSGSGERSLRLWDINTGKELKTLQGHRDRNSMLAFLRSGTQAVSASWDGTFKLWDLATGREVRTFKEDGERHWILFAGFSPSGTTAVSASTDNMVKVWSAADGHLLRTFERKGASISSAALSPDGTRVVVGFFRGPAVIWDVATGNELVTFAKGPGHRQAFSPDGRYVVSGGCVEGGNTGCIKGLMRIWEAATGRELGELIGHTASVIEMAFSRNGRLVASASSDGTVKVWDVSEWTKPGQ